MKIKVLIFAALIVLLSVPAHVLAQTSLQGEAPAPVREIQITGDRAIFTLSDLGSNDRKLFSPYDATRVLFSVPPNWRLAPGGMIELHFEVVLTGLDLSKIQNANAVAGANLIVRFNNVIIGTLNVNEAGTYVQQFQIPDNAMVSSREDGRHMLSIDFEARLSCSYDLNVEVTIMASSFFDLAYQEDSPQLDLARLPAPFYLENSIVSDSTLLVVPDNPDPLELQAALNIAAGFGAMINDDYDLGLVNYSGLDDVRRSENHLVFVGLPEHFSGLSDINFNIPIRNGQFDEIPEESVDDGVLQLALSPWNPSKAILLVSGTTLDALSKAAFALSDGSVFVYQNPALAYVSNVQFLPSDIPVAGQFTLEDLGYSTETFTGIGTVSVDFSFYASKPQAATREGYIDLIYYHSGMLEYGASSFSLYLNDEIFFTDVFSEESEQVTNLRVRIPAGILRYGENRLKIQYNMPVSFSCDQATFLEPWFTVSNHSSFYLPVSDAEQAPQVVLPDLKFFPELFTTSSDLGDVTFVVPNADPAAWQIAGQFSYMFGEIAQPGISNLKVAYSDTLSDEVLSSRSMIVIGKPSDIPFVSVINDKLPAPFDLESNTASEKQLQVSYRIPQGQNVGYLELLRSPYATDKYILLISGNTSDGVAISGDVLLSGNFQDQLSGVFAVTNGVQIATGSATSLFSIVGEGVPGAEQVINAPEDVQDAPVLLAPPNWLLPFVVVSLLIVLGVVVYIVAHLFLRKKQVRQVEDFVEIESGQEADRD